MTKPALQKFTRGCLCLEVIEGLRFSQAYAGGVAALLTVSRHGRRRPFWWSQCEQSRKPSPGWWRLFSMCTKNFYFAVFGSSVSMTIARELLWGRSVTTIQAVIFGMMLSWTPSAVLLAILLWNDPRDPVDQP
jgi:hypothetical protein